MCSAICTISLVKLKTSFFVYLLQNTFPPACVRIGVKLHGHWLHSVKKLFWREQEQREEEALYWSPCHRWISALSNSPFTLLNVCSLSSNDKQVLGKTSKTWGVLFTDCTGGPPSPSFPVVRVANYCSFKCLPKIRCLTSLESDA